MTKRTTVLICGDAGPVRHALLARGDIEVLWTDSIAGALATVRHADPAICLVRPQLVEGDTCELLRTSRERGRPPCVVVLEDLEWDREGEWLAAGAAEVIEIGRSQAILQLIGEYTGLAFAKDARTSVETIVEVSRDGEDLVLETVDVSASGVAIRGFPETRMGALARIAFVVQAQPLVLWARVVRCWSSEGHPMAGLRFVGITAQQRQSLRDFVETKNSANPQPPVDFTNLFDGIGLPEEAEPPKIRSIDLVASIVETDGSGQFVDPDVAMMATYLRTTSLARREELDLPPWLTRLEGQLTGIERQAAGDVDAPAWARASFVVRVTLARFRASSLHGPLPKRLAANAYEVFVSLGNDLGGDTDEAIAEVGAIRAAILRELLARPAARRGHARVSYRTSWPLRRPSKAA